MELREFDDQTIMISLLLDVRAGVQRILSILEEDDEEEGAEEDA